MEPRYDTIFLKGSISGVPASDLTPICAKCNKPVDSIYQHPQTGPGYTYTVRCHGEEQTTTLSCAEIVSAREIRFGKAFVESEGIQRTVEHTSSIK